MAIRIILIILNIFCTVPVGVAADYGGIQKVLVLHSYSYDYHWTSLIQQGIESELKKSEQTIDIHVEYMEVNRVNNPEYLHRILDLYRHKFHDRTYDVIICSDNDAFDFLRAYRDELFPRTPVVFCGVNGYNDSMLDGIKLFTGVAENIDVAKNINLVLQLHPNTKNIVLYGDLKSLTYRGLKQLFQQAFADNTFPVKLIIKEVQNIQQVLDDIPGLPPDSILFEVSYFRSEKGNWLPYDLGAGVISRASPYPLYGVGDATLGYGIVGGQLVTAFGQGKTAGQLVKRILYGEGSNNIPVIKESPNRCMFDYSQLQRFKIALSDLPEDCTIVNKPDSLHERYKGIIYIAFIIFSVLLLIISVLLVNIIQRKRFAKILQESEERYRTLVENLNIGVYRNTGGTDGRYIQANPAMINLFGYDSMEEFMKIRVSDRYRDPSERNVFLEKIHNNGFVKNMELSLRKKDGTIIWGSCTATAQYDEKGDLKWVDGVLEDITERKQVEAVLQESEERLRTQYRCFPIPTITWQKQEGDYVIIDYNIAEEKFTDGRIIDFVGGKASEIFRDRPDILEDISRCFNEQIVVKRETPYSMLITRIVKIIDFTYAYVPPDLILMHFEDVTSRKKAEEGLQKSERELRALTSRLMSVEEKGRKRIAHDLHDGIGQYLTAIKYSAENIIDQLIQKRVDASVVESIKKVIPLIQQTIEETRRIMMDLRPTILDDLGILATISWFCDEFKKVYSNAVVYEDIRIEERDIPNDLKIIIFRIIQESMNNAAKYSNSNKIRVCLQRAQDGIEVLIMDDGKGFDAQHTRKGLGLVSMRERTEGSGGVLSVQSKEGGGTTIRALWPQ